ncbi:hypothetical protein RsS62_49770 [Rhizobium dioscoreae]|uniref:Uncharacterized protein n=1 Tax=Rhizobium dioscoreae TaxID=2653122 RepID=A0ABQ0YYI5_9HYPH|nr:hypothetical protein RsS62_49770 [Rhizobium dioscoreae]GES48088.1 hypothetical protein RsS93_07020 [Rhizobium dioscoreae]GLU79444.1 hypothetical protein Rhsp01_06200 [Rhizobium sp. NBRC 114257]
MAARLADVSKIVRPVAACSRKHRAISGQDHAKYPKCARNMAFAVETVKSIVDLAEMAAPVVQSYLNLLASAPWKSYLSTIWPISMPDR